MQVTELICPTCARKYTDNSSHCVVDGTKLVPSDQLGRQIRVSELKQYLHPSEESRFAIALIVCVPAAFIGLILTLVSFGLILIYIGLITFGVWFSLEIVKASLIANSVKVSQNNFPEVYEILLEVKHTLSYKKDIDVYIIQEGTVNALLAKFFQTKFIILNSELVKGMIEGGNLVQMKWILARFIGALQVKHFRLTLLRIIIEGLEKVKIFNLFILPYERATQYSGDQIGLVICKDLHQAILAFDKLMVGNSLAPKVNFSGLVQQGLEIRGDFFALIARLFSSHPHMISRYLNLLAFSRKAFPQLYEEYVSSLDAPTVIRVNRLLSTYGH